jgi:hypothetical protein
MTSSVKVAEAPSITFAELTLNDRCDRCGAEAMARVMMKTAQELLFCNHHTNRYEMNLIAQGAEIFRKNVTLSFNRAKD